jgi:hypothetical protein
MELLFYHKQEKKDRKGASKSTCELKLFYDNLVINYIATFELEYQRYGSKKHIIFNHFFSLNVINGDITVIHKIVNAEDERGMFRNMTNIKKNNFNSFLNLIENGYIRGEKRINYWGVKHKKALDNINQIILKILRPKFKMEFYKEKEYINKYVIYPLYDLVVDFHLDSKGIKPHDSIYHTIQNEYPKKKWLKKNDNKFLPAVLDSYGIKSKYLIGILNKPHNKPFYISSLNYLCKLFGENYIDYLKQFTWENHCYDLPPNKRTHELKNESEKKCMINVINKWENDTLKTDSLIYSINKLLTIREVVEQKNIDLKFKAKNDIEFDNLMELWSGIKLHFSRGFKLKYILPEEFIKTIEQDIVIGEDVYKPKLLQTEEDFRIEGYTMKNCMSKQFPHGALYLYVSLQHKRKRINLQYRRGSLVQSYGKANTPVIDMFNEAIVNLNERFSKYPNIEWKKEKYDFIKN